MSRWTATVLYRTDTGPLAVLHDLEEIEDLHEIIERGPHWDTVISVKLVRTGNADRSLTVEEAAKL